jgi:aminoglycoside phosphotransferase (APT) family kinase protein
VPPPSRAAAIAAALAVGDAAGFGGVRPVVLQDTNNVVVWLSPHEVVAKVGVWAHSAEVLGREVEVCTQLAAAGAPVAAPIGPLRHGPTTSLPVSLWERLAPAVGDQSSDRALAGMLRRVHAALARGTVELPSYLAAMDHARGALFDDNRMRALDPGDLRLLRRAFDRWTGRAREQGGPRQALHGEPHLGNVVVTAAGPALVDFEAASEGPPEWDLASLPAGLAEAYGDVDWELLARLRLLNSARVATWCWALAHHPTMRTHGEHHLAVVRAAAG